MREVADDLSKLVFRSTLYGINNVRRSSRSAIDFLRQSKSGLKSLGQTNLQHIVDAFVGRLSIFGILHVLRVGPYRGHGLQCYASIKEDQVSPCSVRIFDYLNNCKCERHLISNVALLLLCGEIESNPGPVM